MLQSISGFFMTDSGRLSVRPSTGGTPTISHSHIRWLYLAAGILAGIAFILAGYLVVRTSPEEEPKKVSKVESESKVQIVPDDDKKNKPVRVVVTVKGGSGVIFVDGKRMGKTSRRTLKIAPGRHLFEVRGRRKKAKKSIYVSPGKNLLITEKELSELEKINLDKIKIRSVLTCKSKRGLCQKCYGYDLGYNKLVEIGTAVGIIAAQSIGEPGTQLTMRTFHTGGVAGLDITQGLPRVEELFEARPIKKPAIISDVTGVANVIEKEGQKLIRIKYKDAIKDKYYFGKKGSKITKEVKMLAKKGQKVKQEDILFKFGSNEIKARSSGIVDVQDDSLFIISEKEKIKEYYVSPVQSIWVKTGDLINRGDQLTEGSIDLHQLFYLKSQEAVQKYIIKEIQYIYSSQGQKLNDKHIEIIVRQMFSRVFVKDPGDSNFLPGEIVEKTQFIETNEDIEKKGGKLARGEQLLLGITKASLSIDSFLSAASFQETARVLIDAAVSGRVDRLRGLKENVIIGKLIPAGTGFRKI